MTIFIFVIPTIAPDRLRAIRAQGRSGCIRSGLRSCVDVHVLSGARRLDFDGNRIELPVTDTALRNHRLGKIRHGFRWPAEDDRLDAIVVIQVSMHGGDGHVVVIVLHAHETPCQLALMVVVYVTQDTDAVFRGPLADPRIAYRAAQQVTEGLRAASVA